MSAALDIASTEPPGALQEVDDVSNDELVQALTDPAWRLSHLYWIIARSRARRKEEDRNTKRRVQV